MDSIKQRINTLIDERASVWDRMKELAFEGEDGLANEDVEAYNKAEERLDAITEEIETEKRKLDRFETEEARNYEKFEKLQRIPADVLDAPSSLEELEDRSITYNDAFNSYLRNGISGTTPEQRSLLEAEYRALTTGTGTSGGFTVPEGFWDDLQEARLAFGGLLNAGITRISTGTGQDLPVPTGDDTGNTGALIAENAQVTEQDTTFGQVTLGALTWTSKMIRVPVQLLQDSAFDIASYLSQILGTRIGRVQAGYWATGTGTAEPEGILTGTTSGRTTAANNALTYTDFIEVEHSVDPAYRSAGEYVLSDDALKHARLIVDANGLPLWAPGMAVNDVSPTINGYRYTVDVNFPAVATTTTPVLFGDVSAYWVRDVLGVQMVRLDERFADFLQVAFLAYMRSDGRKVVAGGDPFKVITMAV